MWRWWDISWQVISLGSQYWNFVTHGSGSWGICILKFLLICHNFEGIWNLIWCTHVGLALQPSFYQIYIFVCGHLWWALEDIISIRWERSWFHVEHSWEIFVEDCMILGSYSAYSWIPHKCHASRVERRVPNVYSNTKTRPPFRWACASSTLEAGVERIDWTKKCMVRFHWNTPHFNYVQNRFWRSAFEVYL